MLERAAAWRAGRHMRLAAPAPPAHVVRRSRRARRCARARAAGRGPASGTVKSASLVEVTARANAIDEAAAAVRGVVAAPACAITSADGASSPRRIAAAILIGDRSGLSEADERRLQEAGTYHVIAISGGNIAILAAILAAAPQPAGLRPAARPALAIAALLFYGQIASGGASVSRAVTAACVYLDGPNARSPRPAAQRARGRRGTRAGVLAAGRFRRRIHSLLRRDARHPARRPAAVEPCVERRGPTAAGERFGVTRRSVGEGGHARHRPVHRHRLRGNRPGARERRAVFAHHLRRPAAQLRGDSSDGRHAGCRDGHAGGERRERSGGRGLRICRAPCRDGARPVGRAGRARAVAVARCRPSRVVARGRVLRLRHAGCSPRRDGEGAPRSRASRVARR